MMVLNDKELNQIQKSPYISRDLSWIQFNYRVLDQAESEKRSVIERLKFLAITSSNLDEFFMVRVGSLYNYIDYGKERFDYCGLREEPFRKKLLGDIQELVKRQNDLYEEELKPLFEINNFNIVKYDHLQVDEQKEVASYFKKTIFPMLTPMLADPFHPFPMLMNQSLIFGVVTTDNIDNHDKKKVSFVQIPQNLPRFYEIERDDQLLFIPIEEIIRHHIKKLYRNVEIISTNLMRISRNGDYTLEESEDLENDFIEEIKSKLKTRKTGRVVRVEIEEGASKFLIKKLKKQWDIDDYNIFQCRGLISFKSLFQLVGNQNFSGLQPAKHMPVTPLTLRNTIATDNVFDQYRKNDVLLHHPFNNMNYLLELLEAAAEDPDVLAIKITIYRLADNSRVSDALLKAAENGKTVSVLFEIKARFDEENNIQEAERLHKAGCFVIHGLGMLKTHTKLMLIVRKEGPKITRYVHMSSGNYNESTSKLYTDTGLISSREEYASDVSEFFNQITGHSLPQNYDMLLTAPNQMRDRLIELIKKEGEQAAKGKVSGIVIKINSLQDDKIIDALYEASNAGVPIKLIVRGICCLRPKRKGLSENIQVLSLVGDYLEHSRIYYFHNGGRPIVYGGSADVMVRSFDRRIESLFMIVDEKCKRESINVLHYNIKDNHNSYDMLEDGSYKKIIPAEGEKIFNSQREFYKLQPENLPEKLF